MRGRWPAAFSRQRSAGPHAHEYLQRRQLGRDERLVAAQEQLLAIALYFSDEYSNDYAQKFAIGKTMTVPLSQRYVVQRNDMTFTAQNLDRPTTTIAIDQTATIALEWASIEQALNMERGEERVEEIYLKLAIAYIRQEIENSAAQFAAQNANMIVGQLGTNLPTFDTTRAKAALQHHADGCPTDDENLGSSRCRSSIAPSRRARSRG